MVEVKPVAEEDLHESGMGCSCNPFIKMTDSGHPIICHNTLVEMKDFVGPWGVYEHEDIPPAPKELPHG